MRRLYKPSSFLFGLLSIVSALAGCNLLPVDSSPQSSASQPVESIAEEQRQSDQNEAVTTSEPPVTITAHAIEPLKPEVELSYFGVPKPEEDLSIFDLCQEIGSKLGSVSVADCLNQDFSSDGGLSVLGRPLAMREFPELTERKSLGRVLLIGGIHGDEFSAVSIVFKWMEILDQHHSGIFHWRFIPVSNPDGLLAAISTRQNENGVDLNRNFPSKDWNKLALSYWQEKTESNSRRYPGPSAGSEPEVDWLVKQVNQFQPDVIISVHAPYHLVDYDGPPEAPRKLGDLRLNKLGVYPGSLGNYAGVDLDIPVVTIELPYAGILPNSDQISMMWTDLVAWLVEERSKTAD